MLDIVALYAAFTIMFNTMSMLDEEGPQPLYEVLIAEGAPGSDWSQAWATYPVGRRAPDGESSALYYGMRSGKVLDVSGAPTISDEVNAFDFTTPWLAPGVGCHRTLFHVYNRTTGAPVINTPGRGVTVQRNVVRHVSRQSKLAGANDCVFASDSESISLFTPGEILVALPPTAQ